jgi:arylsulfatase A-like enzyme
MMVVERPSRERERPGPDRVPRPMAARCLRMALSVAVLVVAQGCSRPAAPSVVVGRVGGSDGLSIEPARQTEVIHLDIGSRTALRVPPGTSIAVGVPPGASSVAFSVGLNVEGGAPAQVEFRIVQETDSGSVVLHRETLPRSDAPGWVDHRVDLKTPGTGSLRLAADYAPGSPRPFVRPFFGSIAFLGPASSAPTTRDIDGVVLISLDTLGAAYLAGFGQDLQLAPNIEALRRRGFAFLQTYANYPSTRASHASMLTGLYPRHHRCYNAPGPLPAPTLADDFAAAGFRTAAFTEGGYVSAPFGLDRGFDSFNDGATPFPADLDAAKTFARASDWLEELRAKPDRFFLFVHTYEVHSPYRARDEARRALVERLDPKYDGPHPTEFAPETYDAAKTIGKLPLSPAEVQRMRALYQAEIQYLDEALGEFLHRLAALPFAPRILVILTADHGDQFFEHGIVAHGNSLYNTLLRVPLILSGPDIRPGSSDATVQLVDLRPTILDLLGLAPPSATDGASLTPLIAGREAPARPAFAELEPGASYCRRETDPPICTVRRRAVQSQGFKLIASELAEFDELYDVRADPGEKVNLAASRPQELAQLRSQLAAYDTDAATVPTPAPVEMDPATRERLRALGYAD